MPHIEHSVDGEIWPSVTMVLGAKPKPWIDAWRARIGEEEAARILADANSFGSEVHAGIDAFFREQEFPISLERGVNLSAFTDWIDANVVFDLYGESHVISKLYKYHGTVDRIVTLKDHPLTPVLIDWKTSKQIYPDMALQLSAYGQAILETYDIKIKYGYIVQVPRIGPQIVKVKRYSLTKTLFKKFLKLREAYGGYEK